MCAWLPCSCHLLSTAPRTPFQNAGTTMTRSRRRSRDSGTARACQCGSARFVCVCEWRETQEGGEKEGRRPPYILPLARPHSPPPLFTGMPLHAVPDPGQRFRGHGAGDHVGGDRGRDGRHVKEKAEMDMMADGKRVFVLFFCFRRCESVCRVAPSILFRVCGERSVNHLGECVDGGAWACVDVSLRRKKVGRLVEGLNNNNNNNKQQQQQQQQQQKRKKEKTLRRPAPADATLSLLAAPSVCAAFVAAPHPHTHARDGAHSQGA